MENAISGLIIIGVLMLAMLGISQNAITTQASVAEAARGLQARLAEQERTNLSTLSTALSGPGDTLYVTVKNTGSVKLADFAHWDVIVQYTDTLFSPHIDWVPYGQWTRVIYASAPATLEQWEPDILNPGEEMVITIPLMFTVGSPTVNVVTVSTPNGVAVTAVFTR